MSITDQAIWHKFNIKRRDNLPFTGGNGTRDQLAELFGELGFLRGAEIGVCRGEFSEVLLLKNPQLIKLSCVDPWTPYESYTADSQAGRHQRALGRLSKYPSVEFMKMTSMEAVKQIPNGSLDFVYIDALHDFDSAMRDIVCWTPKVRPNGIVSGHDYCNSCRVAVIAAVDAYTQGHNIQNWYITWEDKRPSWFWVN